jgi:hypothetical protein
MNNALTVKRKITSMVLVFDLTCLAVFRCGEDRLYTEKAAVRF